MFRFFQSFLSKMKHNFQRIAKAAHYEVTAEDVQQDAWLVAHEIGNRRGREIDFSDPVDQVLVIKAVNLANVRRGDWHMRKSVRIDQEREGDDGAIKWSERLPAQASSDPLVSLLLRESAFNADAMLASSYSQAAAYVMVFVHFKNNRKDVCAYLVISDGTLAKRVASAVNTVKVQPSLFDGIKKIENTFMPLPGRQYSVRAERHHADTQWGWEF